MKKEQDGRLGGLKKDKDGRGAGLQYGQVSDVCVGEGVYPKWERKARNGGGVTVGKEFPYVMIPPCIIRDKEFFLVHQGRQGQGRGPVRGWAKSGRDVERLLASREKWVKKRHVVNYASEYIGLTQDRVYIGVYRVNIGVYIGVYRVNIGVYRVNLGVYIGVQG